MDGSSWANAIPEVSTALVGILPNTELWIAEGVYLPTTTLDETISFEIPSDVRVYGGFDGTELLRINRAGLFGTTILSGNITGNPTSTGNTDHVVAMTGADASRIVIDGLVIRDGFADDTAGTGTNARGAGILLNSTTAADEVRLANLTVRNNAAFDSGGGMAGINIDSMQITNCTFRENGAGRLVSGTFFGEGGGLFLEELATTSIGEVAIGNTRFIGNRSPSGGGLAVTRIADGRASIFNCLFHDNLAFEEGGGFLHIVNQDPGGAGGTFFVSHCTVTDNDGGGASLEDLDSNATNNTSTIIESSIFWGNRLMRGGVTAVERDLFGDSTALATTVVAYSDVRTQAPVFPGTGNLNVPPMFKNIPNDNFRLKITSPCIDSANDQPIENVLLGDQADVDLDLITAEFVQIDLDEVPRERDVPGVAGTGLDAAEPGKVSDMGCFENNDPTDPGGPGGPGEN
ncbi:right-handed parallel beta-helix repeat-containing protein [Saltatorellus ferox]